MQISQSGVFKKPDVGDDVSRKRAAPLRHESLTEETPTIATEEKARKGTAFQSVPKTFTA